MSTNTTHFSLKKPATTDVVSQTITDLGTNFDTIDDSMYVSFQHIASLSAHSAQHISYTGAVTGKSEVKGALDDLQGQLDAAIIGAGTSPAEVTAAREGVRGETNTVLNDRLDRIESNIGQIVNISTSSTLTADQRGIILVDTTSGNVTLNLPAIASNPNTVISYIIKKTTNDANTVIVTADGTEKIDGASTFTLSYQNNLVKISNNGSNWSVESKIESFPIFKDINLTDLTASKVVITDSSKNLATSTVSSTTLEYLDIGSSLTTLLAGKEATFSKGDISESTSSVLTISNGTGRLYGDTGLTIQVKKADTSTSGYLSNTDWNTFNEKQAALSFGNLTESTSSVLTISSGTGAVIGSGTTIQVKQASSEQGGYLSSADWSTFNGKQNALSFGNLTESTSSVLTIGSGTGAVIGSGTTIQVKQATTDQSGYLSNTDWNTFNGKQDALSFSNLSGTTDQISLSASGTGVLVGSNNITLSLPQSIATSSSVQFAGISVITTDITPLTILSASSSGIGFFGATPASQQTHIAAPTGGTTTDSEARTAINSILTVLETYGLVANS